MSNLQSEWENALTNLSSRLYTSKDDLKPGKEIAQNIFRVLQSNRKYKIDRVHIMGSIEKNTALNIDFDFDCVIFVNNISPPFDDVFDVFEDVIEIDDTLKAKVKSSGNRGNALHVTIKGLEYDIVPAINFSTDMTKQRLETLKCIRLLECPAKTGYKFSSSLALTQIEFIKSQSKFTHDLIRLAKYWNKTIFIEDYISGRSSLIELIAVSAANDEEKKYGTPSILRGFKSFLTLMKNFNNLHIIFEMFYEKSEVESYILKQTPLVLDPSNPYNNFAYAVSKSPKVMITIQKFAQTTINRLEKAYSKIPININCIFEPQPKSAPKDLLSISLPLSRDWLVGVNPQNSEKHPNMIVRNEKKYNPIGVKIIKHYLWNNINFLESKFRSTTELQQAVCDIIDINIYGKSERGSWVPSSNSHSNYDITFEIQFEESLIRASLKWG